ncbi:ABC transporter substrate-binding protein [Natronospora cellulosivora (SeqCode)]
MKNLSKKTIMALIFFVFLSSMVMGSELLVLNDGQQLTLPAEIIEGRTFLSVEAFEKFRLAEEIRNDEIVLRNDSVEFIFTLDSKIVKVNGVEFSLAIEPYQEGDQVYLPFRFILETLNYRLEWDSSRELVELIKGRENTYPFTIIDGDRSYVIEKEAKSIVSTSPGVTEKLFALGVGERIKGRTSFDNYPPEVSEIQVIGTLFDPNIELIVDISPDIVIAGTHFKEEVLDKLIEAGIATAAMSSANNMEEVYQYMINLGVVVGKNYEARALVSSLKDKVNRVETILNDIAESDRPSIYYIVGTGQREFTAGRNTFISELLSIGGARNIADDVEGWGYSLERLIDHDPDYIIGNQANIDTMKKGDSYQSLSAIREGRYLVVNEDIFSRAAPRAVDQGLKILVELLYGDKINKLNF